MNYSELKTELADWLEDTDILGKADLLIDLAEARHKRDVRIREMLQRDSLTVDDRNVSLPAGFLEMKTLRLLTDPVTVLEEIPLYEMSRVRVESTGKPLKYTVHADIEFDRSPDSSYSGEIIYYKELTALSDANTTNDLSTRAPDVYLYGALMCAEAFLMNDPRIQTWATLYAAAIKDLNMLDRKRPGPRRSRVVGATP